MSILKLSAVFWLLPFAAQAQNSNIPPQATNCVSCHASDGNPLVAGVPILSGQRALYLESALRSYREGRRTGGSADVMQTYTKDLTDEDIKEIAAWFAAN
jgi:cytochrome c553